MINYSSENLAGHITILADEILTGTTSTLNVHAGAELTLDNYKFLVAISADNATPINKWNMLASAQATFDIFTFAASIASTNPNQYELGGSITATLLDEVTIKLGGTWDDSDRTTPNDEQWKVATALEIKITESLTLNGEIGVDGKVAAIGTMSVSYGSTELEWKPDDNFTATIKGWGNEEGAYKFSLIISKSFK